MTLQIIKRNDAHAAGLRRFYTGKPCKYGHSAERFVTTGGCVACNAQRSKAFAIASNNAQGKFVYPLKHPDDHAAAWAYCQALDLARGAMPTQRPNTQAPAPAPFDVDAIRRQAFKGYDTPPEQSHVMNPEMQAQLRTLGVLK